MRVAVVAGPDPGHAFPAIALCLRFLAAGDVPTLFTGTEWLDTASAAGVDAVELLGLDRDRDRRRRRRRGKDSSACRADGGAQRAAAAGAGAGSGGLGCDHRRGCVRRRAARAAVGRTEPPAAVPAVERTAAAGQRTGAGRRHPRPAPRRGDARIDRPVVAGRIAAASGGPRRDRFACRRSRSAATADRHPARAGGAAARLAFRSRGRRPAALRTDVGRAGDSGRLRPGGGRGAVHGDDRCRAAWRRWRWRR